MKTILFIGMSTNGMIADKNGEEEFLSDTIWKSFVAQVKETRSVIMGRKAYEGLLKWPKEYMAELSDITKVVLTSDPEMILIDDWQSANTPMKALNKLKELNINAVTVAGGSKTSLSFLQEQLVDEIIYAIEPVVKADGIHAFAQADIEKKLKLISAETVGQTLLLRYNVV